MSLQYRWNYNSGQYQTDLTRQWQVGSLQGTVDPKIPSLPLNTAVASTVTLSLAVTESSDTVAINASVSGGTITASLAATETSDTVAITGTNRTTASLAVTETSDTVAITGSNRTTFTLAVTETPDTVAITGSNRTTASLAATETADTVAFDVSLASSTATVSFAITEPGDSVSFSVQAAADQPIGGGHAWKGPAEPKYRVHPEYEDKPKKKRRKVTEPETIVLAPDLTVQTGIVPVRPAWDVMAELQQRADEAERIRRAKLRAIALADDEWLMVA